MAFKSSFRGELNPDKLLGEIISENVFLSKEEDKLIQIFDLSTKAYDYSPLRNSGELYTQHPLRVVKRIHDDSFRDFSLYVVSYAHDVLELFREGKLQGFEFSEKSYIKLFNDCELDNLELVTPTSFCKVSQMYRIITSMQTRSLITKIYDILDNSIDQRKFKPQGVRSKINQIEIALNTLKNSNSLDFQIETYPQNTIDVLIYRLEESLINLR